jgi:DNA-binding ferritin-like protein (Dps family)
MLKVMHSTAKSTIAKSPWEDLSQIPAPNTIQWDNIKTQLDLVLIALESLTRIGSEAMLSAAVNLNLESKVPDRVALWRLRQSNPLRKSQGGRKKLDVEEARSLVLIICHLAKQHQEIIRRAVGLLEQMTANKQKPHQTALLGNYIDTFCNTYQERMEEEEKTSTDLLTHLALKLLINLLFYSASGGHRRLWLALIDPATK